ncbi:MAG: aminoacyl-tRNA hydrolase [Candidatus Komeilibacteria bacterium]
MKLIVGLGNPGRKYKKTKHNFGFIILDELAGKNKWHSSSGTKAEFLKTELEYTDVELFKPQTFMNNSGQAVAYAAKKHSLKPEDIIVIYDDLDLEFGTMRIGKFESAGGHNGIKSIIQELGYNNFIRIRLGIKNELLDEMPADKFVLSKFTRKDKKQLEEIINRAKQATNDLLKDGLENVMNKYN